jgi:uncharacterized coiled-coil protein SlyX
MSQINDAFGRPLYDAMRGTPPPTWEQTCLDLDKKLADSRQHIAQLENRLRALWDKLEGERKHYMEHLQLNEELVSEIERENERLKEQNKRQNEAIDSLREMYAKEGKL